MARRKNTTTGEELIGLVAMLPWQAGLGLAVISYLLLHAIASQPIANAIGPGQMGQMLWMAFANIGQYFLPVICLAGAGISAWRRKERMSLVADVAQSVGAGRNLTHL